MGVSQVSGNENLDCVQSDKLKSYLDVAEDTIKKVKLYFEINSDISKNSKPMDCADVLNSGQNKSGIYTIWPKSRVTEDESLDVYCDMDTDGGGWTVIQRRGDFNQADDYFYKDWERYKKGFGNIDKDFWLGNDNIFALTNQRLSSIRFDLQAFDGEKRYAHYESFWIDDENNKYTLHIKNYSGDAGDSMFQGHDNMKFSTIDRDNDLLNKHQCAKSSKGAWWYSNCHMGNLNGIYMRHPLPEREGKTYADGITWNTWKEDKDVLSATEMKIRPRSFEKDL